MMRRIAILVALVLVTLVIVVVLLSLILANPETYRDQITTSVKASTGYNLTIDGEISWRYWPPIALEVSKINVKAPGDQAPLASLEKLFISVELLPLLAGSETISVQAFSLDGLALYPVTGEEGLGNWEQAKKASSDSATTATSQTSTGKPSSASRLALNINSVDITNTTIDFLDASSGEQYLLKISSVTTGPVEYGKPISLALTAEVHDVLADIHMTSSIRGSLIIREDLNELAFPEIRLSTSVHLPESEPVVMALTLSGGLDIAESNLETQLKGTIDESTLTGTLGLTLADTTRISFDLSVDTINFNNYQESDQDPEVPQPAMAPDSGSATGKSLSEPVEDGELIPVETLRKYDIQGKLVVDMLKYANYTFADLELRIINNEGKFHTTAVLHGYDGQLNWKFDSSFKDEVSSTSTMHLKQMDITELTDFEWITGKVDVTSLLSFQGTMVSDAMESLDGTNQFTVDNGTLDITPIKQLASTLDSLRGKQSSISEWPDKMPFEQLKGRHVIDTGTRKNQRLDFNLENLQVTGYGGFDYFANHLKYDITVNINDAENSRYKVSPALANIQWPLHCEGAMDASPADLCFPDRKSIESLLKDVTKQELKRKGKKELDKIIDEKAPEKLKDLLKGLFNQ